MTMDPPPPPPRDAAASLSSQEAPPRAHRCGECANDSRSKLLSAAREISWN